MIYNKLKTSYPFLFVGLLVLVASCGKEELSIQPESDAVTAQTQLEPRTSGSCETIPGFCGRGIYAEEVPSNYAYGLVSNPFGQTGVNHVYGGEVAFLIPDEQDPNQMNPVYSVGGAMDEDVFAEYDGETITVYYKTNNEYLKSLGADAEDNIVSIPEAIYELLESESSTAKDEFSKSGMQSEFTENGMISNIIEGSLSVKSRNNIQISNPDDGEQYLRINQCRFILASTVRRYRTEFVDAYAIITPDSNLDFAISDAVESCSSSFCTSCPNSSCVISEVIDDPRISGANLVVNSLKLNYARVALNLDEDSVDDMSGFINDVTLDQILTIQCGTFGVDGADEGPNVCEAALIASGPFTFGCSLLIINNSGEAFAETENVVVNSVNRVNNCADAFRHAYFNALNTRSCGRNLANLFGIAHECVIIGDPELDDQMDLNNNEDGQRIADDNPNFTDQQISNAIVTEINQGNLDQILPLGTNNQIIPNQSQLVQTTNGCL